MSSGIDLVTGELVLSDCVELLLRNAYLGSIFVRFENDARCAAELLREGD